MHPRLLSDLADLENAAAHRAAADRRGRRALRRTARRERADRTGRPRRRSLVRGERAPRDNRPTR